MYGYARFIKILPRCNSNSIKGTSTLRCLHDRVIDVASMKDVVCESTKEVFHD